MELPEDKVCSKGSVERKKGGGSKCGSFRLSLGRQLRGWPLGDAEQDKGKSQLVRGPVCIVIVASTINTMIEE